ncbi:hypothetical protein ACFLWM_00405 [Chloroflexota bacterium]
MNTPVLQQANIQVSLQLLQPYEYALRLANPGINQMEARTIVYWALSTYHDFDPKPILLIYRSFGCGKSDLLSTILPMVKDGNWIGGDTTATIRDQLRHCTTAFFDEKDWMPEKLLNRRFKKSNSGILINRAVGGVVFTPEPLDINGWTVVAGRKPFKDVALMSRCLIISPRFVENPDARVTDAGSLRPIVDELGHVELLQCEGRAMQVWRPLTTLAFKFNDMEWLSYAGSNLDSYMEEQDLGREYEPEEAVVGALEICRNNTNAMLHEHWIKISDIKRTANTEYDMNLKPQQVASILHRAEREVSTIDGYKVVRV